MTICNMTVRVSINGYAGEKYSYDGRVDVDQDISLQVPSEAMLPALGKANSATIDALVTAAVKEFIAALNVKRLELAAEKAAAELAAKESAK